MLFEQLNTGHMQPSSYLTFAICRWQMSSTEREMTQSPWTQDKYNRTVWTAEQSTVEQWTVNISKTNAKKQDTAVVKLSYHV